MAFVKMSSTAMFMVNLMGWMSLLVSVLLMPLTIKVSNKYSAAQSKLMGHRDQRSTFLTDALLAIRQLKLSAAEAIWEKKILQHRKIELSQQFESARWTCGLALMANVGPIIIAGLPIYIFTLQGNQLSASIVFTYINLFEQLQLDISGLPLVIGYIWDGWTSLRRLEEFFALQEVTNPQVGPSEGLSFQDATITWPNEYKGQERFSLKNLSLEFPRGELSILTGPTGSGKSLLLLALAGEAKMLSGVIGSFQKKGYANAESESQWINQNQLAIVSQFPWIQNTTIKDNIIFGLPFDDDRYNSTLSSCLLHKDLNALEKGDLTKVGPKGVALSGGQRWRIALARALYSRAGLLILDDILGAVDAEVREHLVKEMLDGELIMNRTRILATHDASQCQARAAYTVNICRGKVEQHHRPSQPTGVLSDTLKLQTSSQPKIPKSIEIVPPNNNSAAKDSFEAREPRSHTLSFAYKTYFHATGGVKSWLLVAASVIVYECATLAKVRWLKHWIHQSQYGDTQAGIVYYGGIYLLISSLNCFMIAAKLFLWYTLGLKASRSLFERMTFALFASPLQWLEETPHGEIIARFTSDISSVDKQLPHDIGRVINSCCNVISILFTR